MSQLLYTVEGPLGALRELVGKPGIEVFRSPFLDLGNGRGRASGFAADSSSLQAILDNQDLEEIPDPPDDAAQQQLQANLGKVGFDVNGNRLGYLRHDDVSGALQSLVANSTGSASLGNLPLANSFEGRQPFYVQIGQGPANRLVIGGVHAREWAPVDALVSLCQLLVEALDQGTDLTLPAFVDQNGNTWPEVTVPAASLQQAFGSSSAIVFPLVNSDGRDFALSSLAGGAADAMTWRKNRRPIFDANGTQLGIGVDLNRNFPVAWDPVVYYQPGVEVHSFPFATSDNFRGDFPASEAETQNVMALQVGHPIKFFLDVHSYGPEITFPWAIEGIQTNDSTKSMFNPFWNQQRDGLDPIYSEWMETPLPQRLEALAQRMRLGVLVASAGGPSPQFFFVRQLSFSYLAPGSGVDHATMLGLAGRPLFAERPLIVALSMECGSVEDGVYWPNFTTQFPKVEREVHGAVLTFLLGPSGAWPP
jgi:hypothetical protein